MARAGITTDRPPRDGQTALRRMREKLAEAFPERLLQLARSDASTNEENCWGSICLRVMLSVGMDVVLLGLKFL